MLGPERAFGGEGVAWVTWPLRPSSLAAYQFIVTKLGKKVRYLDFASERCQSCPVRPQHAPAAVTGRMSEVAGMLSCLIPAGQSARFSGLPPDKGFQIPRGRAFP